jgi:hypothetical protein
MHGAPFARAGGDARILRIASPHAHGARRQICDGHPPADRRIAATDLTANPLVAPPSAGHHRRETTRRKPMYAPVRQLQSLSSSAKHIARPKSAPATGTQSPPPRHKLALLTWLGAYPVITVILALLGPAIVQWPLALRTLVLSVLMVVTLTWLVMPGLTRVLRPWLSRPAR